MTTIAYRNGVLAADTLMTLSNLREGHVIKVRRMNGVLAAAAGNWPLALRFLDWVSSGMGAADAPSMGDSEMNAAGHLFLPNGEVLTYARNGWSRFHTAYYADGTGCDIAMGAMAMGASAEEAVRIAIDLDVYSGGRVVCVRF